MQFCKDCGTVLNLFGSNERELCSSCIQQKKQREPLPTPQPTREDLPGDAILSCENDRLILRSREGWELWSGPASTPAELGSILARARRIYEIRLRRQKN